MSLWLDFLFGCTHQSTSLPITRRRKTAAGSQRSDAPRETYVVCLDCGKEFPYSWEEMKFLRGGAKETTPRRRPPARYPTGDRSPKQHKSSSIG